MTPDDPQPRLWGPWKASFHASGSCMVLLSTGDVSKPHLYVFADPLPEDVARGQRNRQAMCGILADWLSGRGPRPVWLDDFYPRGPSSLEALTGAMIVATGPWKRRQGRRGEWRQSNTPDAQLDRQRLLRAVMSRD